MHWGDARATGVVGMVCQLVLLQKTILQNRSGGAGNRVAVRVKDSYPSDL